MLGHTKSHGIFGSIAPRPCCLDCERRSCRCSHSRTRKCSFEAEVRSHSQDLTFSKNARACVLISCLLFCCVVYMFLVYVTNNLFLSVIYTCVSISKHKYLLSLVESLFPFSWTTPSPIHPTCLLFHEILFGSWLDYVCG